MARPGEKGIYEWTKKLPREEIIGSLPPAEMTGYYRCAANLLQQQVPVTKETLLKAAQLSLLAGMREQDLDAVFQAALMEEENHRISSAIHLYECLLKFVSDLAQENKGQLSRQTIAILIKAVERRASLSLFHPNLKQINHFLSMAIKQADEIEDALAQASLHLLIGQNYWMSFQHEQAVEHFDTGWRMIEKGEKNALYRRGLQLQALASWIRGELPGAVQAYEDSLGELDSVAADDFSQLIALHLALCYTQVGMPQRGLGISETIYNQAKKNENGPLVSCALATTGIIFLEIRQLKNSRTYFEMALDVSRRENIPMAEVMAGIGLANICCLDGNYEAAAEHFKVLWKLRKSSWYHTLNSPHVFEAGYTLHRKAVSPVQLDSVVNFLYSLKKGTRQSLSLRHHPAPSDPDAGRGQAAGGEDPGTARDRAFHRTQRRGPGAGQDPDRTHAAVPAGEQLEAGGILRREVLGNPQTHRPGRLPAGPACHWFPTTSCSKRTACLTWSLKWGKP